MRGYLRAVMQNKLLRELSLTWKSDREDAIRAIQDSAKQGGAAPTAASEIYQDAEVDVSVSEADRDPYGIMVWRG